MRSDMADEAEENHVLVENNRESVLIRVSTETTVSQVLCQACEKWDLQYNQHVLKYHEDETLNNDHLMYDCVPPNSTVHLTASQCNSNKPEQVTVSFLGDGAQITKSFNNGERLSQVMRELLVFDEDSTRLSSQSLEARPGSRLRISERLSDKEAKKLLVLLTEGTICLNHKHLGKVSLSDFKHNGHLNFALQYNDLEDVDDSTNDDDSVTIIQPKQQPNIKESQTFNINQDSKGQLTNEDSDPSVTKIKQLIIVPQSSKTLPQEVSSISKEAPLDQQYLLERRGLIYRVEDDLSNPDLADMKMSEASLGVYSESWISVRFPDGFAIQASFSPLEYVYDVTAYVRQFLVHPDAEFELSFEGRTLDMRRSLFTSGLVPSAKVDFIQLHQDTDSNSSKSTTNNGLDPKYLNRVVSQLVATATAVSFRQTSPEILVE